MGVVSGGCEAYGSGRDGGLVGEVKEGGRRERSEGERREGGGRRGREG